MKIKALLSIIIIGFVLAFAYHFIAIAAIDAPHNESRRMDCGSCHDEGLLQSFWGGSAEYSTVDGLCRSCHTSSSCPLPEDTVGPEATTHTDLNDIELAECITCHDPHYQRQKNYKNTDAGELYLAWGKIQCPAPVAETCPYDSESNTTTIQYSEINYKSESGWDATRLTGKTWECRNAILFPNVKKLGYSYPIADITEDTPTTGTITVKGDVTPVYQYISSSDFAVIYGQFIRDQIHACSITTYKSCDDDLDCPVGEECTFIGAVKFFGPGGGNPLAFNESETDTDPTPNGVCQVCHPSTQFWRQDGTFTNHFNGFKCTDCHNHAGGLKPSGDCIGCHAYSIRERAAITPQFNSNSHHVQGVTLDNTHCYQCHWEAKADGTINNPFHEGYNTDTGESFSGEEVDLVIYGEEERPTEYIEGTTAIQYMADGSREEFEKLNDHCLGCHSDQNNATVSFGDGKKPKEYAWDNSSVDERYSQAGTTTWGKYDPSGEFDVTPKYSQTKSYSAHGNAINNQGGWDLDEGWPNNRNGSINVLCFDCHNSHGSSVAGPTTSYSSATANGGILKDTTAGKGGYSVAYRPVAGGSADDKNEYKAGAGLCFDCHMNAAPEGTKPWGYSDTFGASQEIKGYFDTEYFGPGLSGPQQRSLYKMGAAHKGGHFGASSSLSTSASGSINGLCTPCHDPHGVSTTLEQAYSVPLLKGTWMTSIYKEDRAPASTNQTRYGAIYDPPRRDIFNGASIPGYHVDQNTKGAWWWGSGDRISETDSQFGGLCLTCHAKSAIDPDTVTTWKSMDRIHETVKGWGSNTRHSFPCSKCHTPHSSRLPRLMITSCLNYEHRGRVGSGGYPDRYSDSGSRGSGAGRFPAGGHGYCTNPYKYSPPEDPWFYFGRKTCHQDVNEETDVFPERELWNTVTMWQGLTITAGPNVGVSTVGSDIRATVTWTTDAPSTSYVDYGLTADYDSSSGSDTLVTNHSVLLTGLSNHSTYHYRVLSQGDTATGSEDKTFIVAQPPSTPILTNVPYYTSTLVDLAWEESINPGGGGPLQYRVQVADEENGFGSPEFDSGWTITETSWQITVGFNTTWWWRVRARDATYTSYTSSWSGKESFMVVPPDSPPPVPTLTDEPDFDGGGTDTLVTLEWIPETDPDGHAVEYYVEVADNPGFSSPTTSGWISATSFDITVGPCTEWWWRVKARDASDLLESGWSTVDAFADVLGTDCDAYYTPTVPVLIDEPDNECGLSSCSVNLQWNASTGQGVGPIEYYVQVDNNSTFGSPEYTSGWITATSWSTPWITRDVNTTWFWRVKARDSNHIDAESDYALIDAFRVVPTGNSTGTPTIPYPILEPDHVCTEPCLVTLEWYASTNPTGNGIEYIVYGDDDSDFSSLEFNSGWITETSYEVTIRPYNGVTRYWHVKARDAVTLEQTLWSDIDSFTVTQPPDSPPLAPILIPEPDFSGATTVTLQWYPEPDPDGHSVEYFVEVANDPGFSSPTTSGWISATSFDVSVGSCTEWFWRVKARDAVDLAESLSWSDVDFFVDVAFGCAGYFTPSVPVLIDEPNTNTGTLPLTLEWNASTGNGNGPYEYKVNVDDDPAFGSVNHDSGWITGTSWQVSPSTGKWYWRVRARDPNHSSTTTGWSDSDFFWVLSPGSPPPAPTLTDEPDFDGGGTDTDITLEWLPETDPDGNGVEYYVEVDDNDDFSSPEFIENWDSSDTSFAITVASCKEWWWRVKARDASDLTESGWSSTDDFKDSNGSCVYTIIDESFEGVGYEESWTETTTSGSTIYEDSSIPGTAPAGSGSQCLRSISGSSGYKAFATRDYGTEQANTSTTFYLYLHSEGLSNGESKQIGTIRNNAGSNVVIFRLNQNNSGVLRFQFRLYNNGGWNNYNYNISLDTWYKIRVKYDDVGNYWEWWVDDISQDSGSLTGTHYTGVQQWTLGFQVTSQAETGTIYYDMVEVKINE